MDEVPPNCRWSARYWSRDLTGRVMHQGGTYYWFQGDPCPRCGCEEYIEREEGHACNNDIRVATYCAGCMLGLNTKIMRTTDEDGMTVREHWEPDDVWAVSDDA